MATQTITDALLNTFYLLVVFLTVCEMLISIYPSLSFLFITPFFSSHQTYPTAQQKIMGDREENRKGNILLNISLVLTPHWFWEEARGSGLHHDVTEFVLNYAFGATLCRPELCCDASCCVVVLLFCSLGFQMRYFIFQFHIFLSIFSFT